MGTYRARRMREVRVAQLGAMHPVDLADAVRLLRRLQIEMLRRESERQQRCANDNAMLRSGRGPALIGELITVLGFEAEEDHPLEQAQGLGADVYRRYVGIDQ